MFCIEKLQKALANVLSIDEDINYPVYRLIAQAGERSVSYLLAVLKQGTVIQQYVALRGLENLYFRQHSLTPDTAKIILESCFIKTHPLLETQAQELLILILARNPDKEVQASLLEFLYADEPLLRESAAVILGEIREPQAIPHLATLLDDGEPRVVLASRTALSQMKAWPQAQYALTKWEKWNNRRSG